MSTSTSISTSSSVRPSSTGCSSMSTRSELVELERRGREILSLEPRQRPFPSDCMRLCNIAAKQEYPVWEIGENPGETDQLVYSMCKGIMQRVKDGKIQPGLDDGEDVLEYNGKGVRETTSALCRPGGVGFCREVSLAAGAPFECDEYPPAVLNPRGGAQTRWCVPKYQNSGTQGPMLSNFLKKCGVKGKDKMMVKIKGGCKRFNFARSELESEAERFDFGEFGLAPAPNPVHTPTNPTSAPIVPKTLPRESLGGHVLQRRATIQLDASNGTLRNPNGDSSLLYVAVEIDELADGHYEFNVQFDGTIESVTVLNKYGEDYASASSPSGSASLSFDITDGSNLPAALIAWTSRAVTVSYAGTGTLKASGDAALRPMLGMRGLGCAFASIQTTIPTCKDLPITIAGEKNGVPPYYMVALAVDGTPTTTLIGTTDDEVSYQVRHPVGTRLLLSVTDSEGNPGGTFAPMTVVAGDSTSCVNAPPASPTFTVHTNITRSNASGGLREVSTCDFVALVVTGGTGPYNIMAIAANSPAVTNDTMARGNNVYTYVNRALPGGFLVAAVSDSTGQWATGTPLFTTKGGNTGGGDNTNNGNGGNSNGSGTGGGDSNNPPGNSNTPGNSNNSNGNGTTSAEKKDTNMPLVIGLTAGLGGALVLALGVTLFIYLRKKMRVRELEDEVILGFSGTKGPVGTKPGAVY
ncbi:hypothetical protein CVT24_007814 [Panaeolus cyanescens]|uniref:Deoxyribonuclease NucA/NucB domain-containing protein n=1 Tax=Panaeolus cyanescens TaxID=181874 RepID=A0A409WLB4_9AGAR|nr:hypothetical protein CVT24_007814 [Panaeolus cyanescens]